MFAKGLFLPGGVLLVTGLCLGYSQGFFLSATGVITIATCFW